jgi:hypothetical protein
VFSKPNGEPIASTHSPTLSLVGVAEAHRRQARGVELEQREVGAPVAPIILA